MKRSTIMLFGVLVIAVLILSACQYFQTKPGQAVAKPVIPKASIGPIACDLNGIGDSCGTAADCCSKICVSGKCSSGCKITDICSGSNLVHTDTNCTDTTTACQYGCANGACNPAPKGIYQMNVVQIKYFPIVNINGNWYIDITETGDVGQLYDWIRYRTIQITSDLMSAISQATTYLGYKNSNAPPSLQYNVLATFEHNQSFPKVPGTLDADYPLVLTNHNVCDYVDNQNVKEFWIFAYQGPSDSTHPNGYLHIFENRLSSPYQILGPGTPQWLNLPICNHSYWVYTFNYQRGSGEAFHSWSHRIENEMDAFDFHLHREIFQGITTGEDPEFQMLIHPQADNVVGRCGSVHIPPNAEQEYDYNNPKPWQSDCEDWNPDGLGKLSAISCTNWGCDNGGGGEGSNSQLNYLIWLWQHLPGYNNQKSYHGVPLRNWWSLYANYDQAIKEGWSLTTQNRPRCTDSDGSFNIHSKGTAYGAVGYPAGGFLHRTDRCIVDSIHLVEYSCDSYNGVSFINETLVSNLPCSDGVTICGGTNQSCCPGNTCSGNLTCIADTCQ